MASRHARRTQAPGDNPGVLVIVGGGEEKEGAAEVLRFIADRVGRGRLVIMTCATEDPQGAWERYRRAFSDLGVEDLAHVDIRDREAATDEDLGAPIDDARGVFFTGGDQLRITSHIGATPAYRRIVELLQRGGLVAGTSAGAAAMSGTMLVSGASENTPTIDEVVRMAPGLGLLPNIVVDMHFSERGRLGRLVGAVAQNPRVLGLGIDEDTAAVVEGETMTVIGSGGVYVVDGRRATNSNIADSTGDEVLSIENVTLHLFGAGRRFDLQDRHGLKSLPEAA
jgi:cyanophycinase